jgi:hypothetical protein
MISFTIKGNQENPNGNPLPKNRKTYRQQWTTEARRYQEYHEYVRGIFLGALLESKKISHKQFRDLYYCSGGRKPIDSKKIKGRMKIFITWADETHGDPENIFGAIADALFVNDKYLAVVADFDPIPKGKGRVDVEIEIPAQ